MKIEIRSIEMGRETRLFVRERTDVIEIKGHPLFGGISLGSSILVFERFFEADADDRSADTVTKVIGIKFL